MRPAITQHARDPYVRGTGKVGLAWGPTILAIRCRLFRKSQDTIISHPKAEAKVDGPQYPRRFIPRGAILETGAPRKGLLETSGG